MHENTNGRQSGGFSLRRSLLEQGVSVEGVLRGHLLFVYETLLVNPFLDITRYRVNRNDPNAPVGDMG